MNEEFIKQFRKLPDANFVEKTHARLERKEHVQTMMRYSVLSTCMLFFIFGILMTFSSTARAAVLQVIEEIAGLRYEITNDYPGHPDEGENIIPAEYLSLEEARRRSSFPVMLPAYVPPGYERQGKVSLTNFADPDAPLYTTTFLDIHWETKGGNIFMLSIRHCPSGIEYCGWIVGEGALEEITLNGRPAVIQRGAWNSGTQQYDLSVAVTVIQWKYDENTVYSLTDNQKLPLDELIRIAESIP